MREMKDSGIEWVGKIPKHWSVMHNKYIMTKKKTIKEIYGGEDIISLSMNGVIVRDLDAGGKMPKTFDGYQIVHPGNLLMCLFDYDVTPRCIGLIKNFGVTSPAYSQFVMNKNNHSGYYNYYYLMVDHTKALLHLAKNLRHSFTEEQLGSISAPVPPVEEQIEIEKFLDQKCSAIDAISSDIQKQITILEDYKKSVITEAVTKGLNPDVEMKDTGVEWIGKIPKHWDVIRNLYLFREFIVPAKKSDISLSLSQKDGLVLTDEMKESSLKTSSYDNWKHVETGDLVLNRFKAHLGVLFSSKYVGMVSFHYGVYKEIRALVSKYYEYLFHTDNFMTIFAGLSNGVTVGLQNLSNQNFYSVKSIYPPIDEQKIIVQYLDEKCSEIDSLISDKKKQLEILAEYKKSLIYEYVTGKKEVLE